MAYTNTHKLLLQAVTAKHVMSNEDLSVLFRQLTEQGGRADTLEQYISSINEKLHSLALEIRKMVAEEDGQLYWGLVNTREDEHMKGATDYTLPELSLFKKIAERIITGDTFGHTASADAINAGKAVDPPLTYDKSESVIDNLIEQKWLAKVPEGITLGVRSMLELRPYIESLYGEQLPDCTLCSEVVLRGSTCANDRCSARMHSHCGAKWFAGKREKKCPACTLPWRD